MSGKRRTRGEGSISRRKDGRYMGRLDLGWVNGKRTTKTIYGRTRKDVAIKLADANKAARDGSLVTDERQTVAQFLSRWVDETARTKVRPRTLEGYIGEIDRHIVPHLGRTPISKLSPQHVQAWLTSLERLGVSANRRRYARAVLRAALTVAMRYGMVTRNAAALVEAPRVERSEMKVLGAEQVVALLGAVDRHPLGDYLKVALTCGLRLGETIGLQWADLDLEARTLTVRRTVQRYGGDPAKRRPLLAERKRLLADVRTLSGKETGSPEALAAARTRLLAVRKALAEVKTSVHLDDPKTAKSRRTISIPESLAQSLKALRRRQKEAHLAAGQSWSESAFVFATPKGTTLDPRNIRRAFADLLVSLKLPKVRVHDLRHSCASYLLANGVYLRLVSDTLGHSNTSVTLNTYAHVMPTRRDDAAIAMDSLLRAASDA